MPRSSRIHASDLIYHVFSRGNNKEPIFFEEKDYQRFLDNLERYRQKFHYALFAYCLMPNHFHLLLKVQSVPLSKIMQVLITAYTMYFNKKHDRVGHVFQGRYKSIIVDKESYLLQVHRYIHLNPVKAGNAKAPQQYLWSSYRDYFSGRENMLFLETEEILGMLTQNLEKQKQFLEDFTLDGIEDEFDPFQEQVRGVLGSQKFLQKLTKVLRGARP